jgi:3-oxoisoapionate decarboxylase
MLDKTEVVAMGRRPFLRQMALVSTSALAAHSFEAPAVSEAKEAPAPRPLDAAPAEGLRLGFDTYSIRDLGWKDFQYLDYAASLHLDNVQLSSLNDYASLDPIHLQKVRDHAERLGITVDSGTGCICPLSAAWDKSAGTGPEAVLAGLKVAKAVGAHVMRCVQGTFADRHNDQTPLEACMEETIRVFRAVKSQALDLGVKIALENHAGDMQAREILTIIRESGPEFVGSCLDTGNPIWVMENPVVTMEVLGAHVLTTHVRDTAVFDHPRGAAWQWVALGEGNVDLRQIVSLHQQLCPQAAINLEIITGRAPDVLPYREQSSWKYFPKTLASEFVRFVELARTGRPFMGNMVIEDGAGRKTPEFAAALREQQRIDLERSLEFAKTQLGAGVRWKQA